MATAKKISHGFTGNPSKRDSYEPRPGYKQRGRVEELQEGY